MSKKLLISLGPLFATVAFAAMPAVAQADHYEVSKEAAPVERVPYISWGKLALTNTEGGTPVECENAVGGWVEKGGENEETTGWTAYNCTDVECENAPVEPLVPHIGVIFENENAPETNPVQLHWPGKLETQGTNVRLKSENVQVFVHCNVLSAPPKEEEETEGPLTGLYKHVGVEWNLPGSVTCWAGPIHGGTSKPKTVNQELPIPGKLTFTGGNGGELECSNAGKGITTGSLKTLGFNNQEEISTVKP
jgi:hypothetical protein